MLNCLENRLKCECGENCFCYFKIREKKECKSKIEYLIVNKCNRLIEEGSKKIPCKFYNEKIVEEKDNIINNNNMDICTIKEKPVITFNDIKKIIYKMLENYHIKSTNYFGKLNKYLQMIGYDCHDPPTESLSELISRLSKKPIKKKNIIYNYSREQQLTQNIGEYDFDYDEECNMLDRIKNKIDLLDWTKNDTVQYYLKRPVKKSIKSVKVKKQKTIVKQDLDELAEEDEENEENEEEDEENEESDEENEQSDKDNEFDIEQESDNDDYDDNNDYDDFSD